MPESLQQSKIQELLREQGISMSLDELRSFLKANHARIDGASLEHRCTRESSGKVTNWFEIHSPISQESANRRVVEFIAKEIDRS